MPKETAYIHTQTAALVSGEHSIEGLINSTSNAKASNGADPPSAKELQGLYDSIKNTVMKTRNQRGAVCARSMRQLAQQRKERSAKRAKAERKKVGKKRNADEMEGVERTRKEDIEEVEEEKGGMPDVGVRGGARQDGVGVGEGESE